LRVENSSYNHVAVNCPFTGTTLINVKLTATK
jgi:hypothetical protein